MKIFAALKSGCDHVMGDNGSGRLSSMPEGHWRHLLIFLLYLAFEVTHLGQGSISIYTLTNLKMYLKIFSHFHIFSDFSQNNNNSYYY